MTNYAVVEVKTKPCMRCNNSTYVTMDTEKYERWKQNGEYVQDVFPDWTPSQRELLISGTHPDCWVQLFGEDE